MKEQKKSVGDHESDEDDEGNKSAAESDKDDEMAKAKEAKVIVFICSFFHYS